MAGGDDLQRRGQAVGGETAGYRERRAGRHQVEDAGGLEAVEAVLVVREEEVGVGQGVGRVALQMSGRLSAQPWAASSAAPILSTVKSPWRRPTICRPVGRPAAVAPEGTESAGQAEIMLNGKVIS